MTARRLLGDVGLGDWDRLHFLPVPDPRPPVSAHSFAGTADERSRHQRPRPRRAAQRTPTSCEVDRRAHAPEEGGTFLEGPLPVSQRAHAVLHGRPREGPLPLLRLRGRRRRHPLRPADRSARLSRGGRGARLAVRRRRSRGAPRAARGTTGARSSSKPIAAAQRFYAGRYARSREARRRRTSRSRGVLGGARHDGLALGYAPDSWDALSRHLSGAFPESAPRRSGSVAAAPGRQDGSYDRFRDRLLFVLRDERGRPVGFGGRALAAGAGARST